MNKDVVFEALNEWICDNYSCDIRYMALGSRSSARVLSASITFYPVAPQKTHKHTASVGEFHFGFVQRKRMKREFLIQILSDALNGAINVPGERVVARLPGMIYIHPLAQRNDQLWFQELRHVVQGAMSNNRPRFGRALDNGLRILKTPFDGLQDVISWLGLTDPREQDWNPRISVAVLPPADLLLEECVLGSDKLSLSVIAHSSVERDALSVMVRVSPGLDLVGSRIQVAPDLIWKKHTHGAWKGKATIAVPNADAALVVLMTGSDFIRRHWFVDSAKSRNTRFVGMQLYDRELKQLRRYLSTPLEKDSAKFEQAVACALFLKGYSSTLPVETDAPDILAVTPGGQIIIVECTVRVSDVHAKMGKLVDRRLALKQSLDASGHPRNVISVLVCSLPRDNIAATDEEFRAKGIMLVAHEDILRQLDSLHFLADPDQELNDAKAAIFGQHSSESS
ncbi:hypothetical protein ACFWZ4_15890 [Frateuria sp. GZRe12]|uniref:hypothetical protein n=1 Tax=Frateuria sp. GZRe12 TaxID=3351533 RepID=UPI003EDBE36B